MEEDGAEATTEPPTKTMKTDGGQVPKGVKRDIPKGFKRHVVPSDGACLFWAAARALADSLHQPAATARKLRADVLAHLSKQRAHYEKYWGGLSVKGEKMSDFNRYITEMSSQTAYGGALELKAIATKWHVKFIVFFEAVQYSHTHKPEGTIHLWFTSNHYDWLSRLDGVDTDFDEKDIEKFPFPKAGARSAGHPSGRAKRRRPGSSLDWRTHDEMEQMDLGRD